ncbi:MAG: precorrin-4/cobalt-precorrin-4 C11-methyltransferase [Halobacteriales archaeon]|jgi:precorrin-4/cobalt-precorrin-4 C11-methyltransferase
MTGNAGDTTGGDDGWSPGDERDGIPFVGAGPGDPRLLTVAGREALEGADLVVHAGSLVNADVLETYCPDAEHVNSHGKDLETLVPLMADAHESGRAVVRLHSGDPSIYGAVTEQMDALADRGVPTYVVPGVTAAAAASATLGTELTLKGAANHVAITRPRGKTLDAGNDHVSEFVEMGDVTTCLYLGTHAIDEVTDRLLADGHDPETPAAVVYHASWPDEDVIRGTIEDIAAKVDAAGYRSSALVLIGDAVAADEYDRSHLYDGWADAESGADATGTGRTHPDGGTE